MKLSEAIRLGTMLGPQTHGAMKTTRRKYLFGLIGTKVKATCALGAANEAEPPRFVTGISDGTVRLTSPRQGSFTVPAGQTYTVAENNFDGELYVVATCPDCNRCERLMHLIPHLNDDHRWTRERIADFVEQIENTVSTTAPEAIPVADRATS